MDVSDLTERQISVLDFIIKYQQAHHIAPSVRDIAARLGLRSPSGIHRILNILKDKGYILAEPGKKRSWRFARGGFAGRLPLIGTIAAGTPVEAIENVIETLDVDPALFGCDRCYGLRVKGHSMIRAHIASGDIAIIRPQQQVENGEIAAVLVQGLLTEATLKIIRRTKTRLTLKPANPKYRSLVFKGADRERVSIIGKYVGVIRRV